MIGKPTAGNVAQAQGKDVELPKQGGANKPTLDEERKENRATIGQQVMNGMNGPKVEPKRQTSASKRKPTAPVNPPVAPAAAVNGRNTQAAGWARGQLPVALQQQKEREAKQQTVQNGTTSNSMYGTGVNMKQTANGMTR
jgi:hypothetical protein